MIASDGGDCNVGVTPRERGFGAWLSFRREKVPGIASIAVCCGNTLGRDERYNSE